MSDADRLVVEVNRLGGLVADLRAENTRLVSCLSETTNRAVETEAAWMAQVAEARNERDMAKADAAAVRSLMNTYNLGGWTDALGPMERALVAEALADPYVCDFIRNESGELEEGWREIDIQPEGMEHELRYAAARHLIERHAEVLGRFRFTDAGKEHL